MRAKRPPRWYVQRDVQILIRTFPTRYIVITRPGTTVYVLGVPRQSAATTVFGGEALLIPASGDVTRYGLGQVEEDQPQLLVPGRRRIQQGDFVALDGKTYQVEYQPDAWHAFVHIRLAIYQQGSR